jgi:hypothetical protein
MEPVYDCMLHIKSSLMVDRLLAVNVALVDVYGSVEEVVQGGGIGRSRPSVAVILYNNCANLGVSGKLTLNFP